MDSVEDLDKILSTPSDRLLNDLRDLDGDLLILGVAGKMGPSLAMLAKRAFEACGHSSKVIGVSRFSKPGSRDELERHGIETIPADLMDDEALQKLPDAKQVIYLAGTKFGTSGNECYTWAMNSYLPGRVAHRYSQSNIVAFSTGNVYPFSEIESGGKTEKDPTGPIGEYAQSCLGRERIFEYFSKENGTPTLIYRLNYAIDMRYGVLLEIARSVYHEKPIDLRMGYVNVIWQGDANEVALRALKQCDSPAEILNVTGPEVLSVKELASRFGKHFGKTPRFENSEAPTALLSNARKMVKTYGEPLVSIDQMIDWTANWVEKGLETHDKPTHFQEREGNF
jgi:nucleoside-diphosphate-sugar epimerase